MVRLYYIRYIKHIIYILLFLISFQSFSQNFGVKGVFQAYADKEFYLIDSLILDDLVEGDKKLLESSLKQYHQDKDDTSKINALSNICENMMHVDWAKYQFLLHKTIEESIERNKSGAIKLKLLNYLANSYNNIGIIYGDKELIDKEIWYYQKSLNIYEQLNDEQGIADVYNNIGFAYGTKGEMKKSLSYYQKSLRIVEKTGDKSAMALSFNNIGIVYEKRGDVKNGLKFYHKSLKIQEELNDKKGMAMSYVNIGSVMKDYGDKIGALEYYQKALKLQKEIGNLRGVANCLANIAVYYGGKDGDKEALKYFYEALYLFIDLGDKSGEAKILMNIGAIYYYNSENEKAYEKLKQSLDIRTEHNISIGLAQNHIVFARLYTSMGELELAEHHATKALDLSKKLGYPDKISEAAKLLSYAYAKKKNGMLAYDMYKLHIVMRDSIKNIDNLKNAAIQEAKYMYEKEKELDNIKHQNEIAIEKESKAKQRILIYASAVGFCLVIVFLIFVFNRLKVTRHQKSIIDVAYEELGDKNKEIMDSITYAKRIQSAILPPMKEFDNHLKDGFVLYKPKDVVAGDFYWLEHVSNKTLFAAADCTGHGVPGAMVSVICNNALNRSIREHGLVEPGEILDKTREIVIEEFEKSDEEVKDGMDIAICSLEGNILQYAGAHNPLWIVRNGKLLETKANKQPIGHFDHPEPYTTHNIELEPGDSIYIFSDGYVDQFGGEKEKKFKAKSFRELLLSIQEKPMEDQKRIIDETFEAWKGDLEQIDDVCIIGVRI